MITDCELLELAAKAAGYNVLPHLNSKNEWVNGRSEFYFVQQNKRWNPLTNDGDALRLAVDLDLAIVPYPIYNKQKHSVLVQKKSLDESRFEKMELHGDDPRAATRRAIVSAAAEIGKAMP